MDKLEKWRGYVPDEELETYRKGGFAQRVGMGERVALLNIDTTHMFVDPSYSMCGRDMTTVKNSLIQLTQYGHSGTEFQQRQSEDRSHMETRQLPVPVLSY